MERTKPPNVSDQAPRKSAHYFGDTILGNRLFFYVTKFIDCFHVTIGTSGSSPFMTNMAGAMPSDDEKGAAAGSSLCGDTSDPVSIKMAHSLAKQTGKTVFVSLDIPYDSNLLQQIEKRVMEEFTSHPDCF